MAQTLEIPARIQLSAIPLVWSIGKVEYMGPVPANPQASMFRVTDPSKYSGMTLQLPIEDRAATEVLISDVPDSEKGDWPSRLREVDGWKMRDDFLRLDRSTPSLAKFLNEYGVWDSVSFPTSEGESHKNWRPSIVLPQWIWFDHDPRDPNRMLHVQELIRWGLTCRAEKWFDSGYGNLQPIGPQSKFPHFVIQEWGCERVMLTTVTIDRLRNVKYRLCGRPDCKRPFALKTKHQKTFCSQYCGHLESVRRNRS